VTPVTRDDDLEGLAAMIADLVEANLAAHPERASLLEGNGGKVKIVATDVDSQVAMTLGQGKANISSEVSAPTLVIETDSATLLDLPNAKLMMGFPSVLDPVGRSVIAKVLRRQLKIRGGFGGVFGGFALLSKVQRLLSVA
jgi:hypothetical protein